MASKKTKGRSFMHKLGARVAVKGRRKRHDNVEDNRKKKREQILQNKRREDLTASTSSVTNQPLLDFSSSSLEKRLESLPQMVAGVNSGDPYLQLQATVRFRELLSIDGNPPTNQVIQSGVIPRIVQLLSRAEFPLLQHEAAVVLTIILDSGTSENIQVIIDNAPVPLFVRLLSSDRKEVREQAVYALGHINIVGVSLPALEQLLHSTDDEKVLSDACLALSYLSYGTNDKIQAVIDSGVVPHLVQLLAHPSRPVLLPALRTIRNIVTGDDTQIQVVLDHSQALPGLLNLLIKYTDKKSIMKETCRTISKITAGNPSQIQEVIEAGIFPHLVELVKDGELEIKKKALRAFSNVTSHGSHDQIRFLASQAFFDPLKDLLGCSDPRVVKVTSDLLEKIENLQSPEKVDSDDPIFTKYIGPPIDTDDERYELLLHPRKLTLQNLSLGTKKSDIISFFERTASISLKKSQVWAEPVVQGEKTRTFIITLSDVAETPRAIRMHGELVGTRHIFVTRQMGDRRSVYVSGFSKGLGKDGIKKELQEIFNGHATIISIYLPNDEFGYIIVGKCDKHFKKALEKGLFRNGEAVITIRDAFMLPQILDEFSP